MPKLRSAEARPLLRKQTTDPKAKLSSRNASSTQSQPRSAAGAKKESAKGGVVHLHQNEKNSSYMTHPAPWWAFPEERGLMPGMMPGGMGGMMPGGMGGMMPGGMGGMIPGGPGGMMPGGPGGMIPGGPGGTGGLFPPGSGPSPTPRP
jgi:hypothetical protein